MLLISPILIRYMPKALNFSNLFCGFMIDSIVSPVLRFRVVCSVVRCVW